MDIYKLSLQRLIITTVHNTKHPMKVVILPRVKRGEEKDTRHPDLLHVVDTRFTRIRDAPPWDKDFEIHTCHQEALVNKEIDHLLDRHKRQLFSINSIDDCNILQTRPASSQRCFLQAKWLYYQRNVKVIDDLRYPINHCRDQNQTGWKARGSKKTLMLWFCYLTQDVKECFLGRLFTYGALARSED
ncbi:hypothetical protein YC2023_098192 [Brassica napus]